jgi:uroporphyrinogen-III synthase
MAVGPKTAQELKTHKIPVSLVPAEYSSEGILQCLQQHKILGKSIYIPRISSATPFLANKPREVGGKVQEIYVYESLLPVDQKLTMKFFLDVIDGKIHAIIFRSSLGVKNFFQMLMQVGSERKLLEMVNSRLAFVAIGPMTARTLSKKGVRVDVMLNKYLFEEALIALARYWNVKG